MKTATIIGATGLVGSNLLRIINADKEFESIVTITRTNPNKFPGKTINIPFDSGNYSIPNTSGVALCCLGTTMKKAGSKEAFLKVDHNMVVDFAKKCKDAGIKRFAMVSSIGASPNSGNFYLRTKGKAEEELKKIGFERLVIVRPSLLLGKRNEKRLGEDIGKVLYSVFRFIFVGPLKKYRGIPAEDVAKAMLALVNSGEGTVIAESNSLKLFSDEYENQHK
jgi:uncharacterized protein YbjT (DUF2867 family)